MREDLCVAVCVGCTICLMISITATVYLCSGAWRLYRRIRIAETHLADVDTKILSLIATMNGHLALQAKLKDGDDQG